MQTQRRGFFWAFLWVAQVVFIVLKVVGVEPFTEASWAVILIPFWMWVTVFVIFLDCCTKRCGLSFC